MLTAAAVLPSGLVMALADWSPDASRPAVAAAVLVGIGLWLVALRRLRHPLYGEIAAQVIRLRRRGAAA